MKARLLLAALALSLSAATAHADPAPPWADEHYPDAWHGQCAGGHAAFGAIGYCDGSSYPDGTHWHQNTGIGMDALKPHCSIGDAGMQEPPSPAGGCGGQA